MPVLYVAFKGNGNSSNKIVRNLNGDKLFLTNSYGGSKKDIDNIDRAYDLVYMFGLDKNLKGTVRIDRVAQKDEVYLHSTVNVDSIAMKLDQNGIITNIGDTPTRSLCNEAYWYMLRKYNCHVIFIHVPSIKYVTEDFIGKVRAAL